MTPCPLLEEQPFENMGDAVLALDYTIDQYTVCRKRMDALIEYERKKQ